jgi:tRNA-Thr(GGU) m(6)t(6)A37 methyltransferase TsaA
MTTTPETYSLHPVGFVRSSIRTRRDAPCQGNEGAPDVWLDLLPAFAPALRGVSSGAEVMVITWLHQANRDVLEVHPRRNPANPLTGVFFTRSPDRPNPLGLHRVTVREIAGHQLRIGPMEAIDGTPVVDIKAVLDSTDR